MTFTANDLTRIAGGDLLPPNQPAMRFAAETGGFFIQGQK
jgi:hypothetical protein